MDGEMLLSVGYGLVGWLLAVQAVGLFGGLAGFHLLPRATPRVLGLALAGGAAACWWLAGVWWLVPALALPGILGTAALGCFLPRRPDRRYLPPSAPGVEAPEIPGHADAGALYLRPRTDGAPRTVVVLSHGGGNDRLFGLWLAIDEFREAGHGVLTAHLAGHGAGGSDIFALDAGRARLDALITRARGRAGDAPVVVLGQSVGAGGARAGGAGGGAPVGVGGVGAAADGLDVGAGSIRELMGLCRPSIYRALAYGNTYEVLPAVGRFKRGAFPVRVGDRREYIQAFDRTIREMRLSDRLRDSATCPVLIVHGTRDGVIGVRHAGVLGGALGGRATTLLLPGATHMDPLFDTRAIRGILGWLDGLR